MFLGTGAASEATLFCQRVFNAKGVKGNWATFATLASAAGRTMFTRPNPHDVTRFDRPFPIRVTCDGREFSDGPQLLAFSTTLEKLILGAHTPCPAFPAGSCPSCTAVRTAKCRKGP